MTEREIFVCAYQRTDPDERRRFLDQLCANQPDLKQRIEDLLALAGGAGSFLEEPVEQITPGTGECATVWAGGDAPAIGTLIDGRNTPLQQIGEGGMGTVFLAQQAQPVKRLVALKVIKPGMDSRGVLVRFEAERQALALMDHPNIARVLDAGSTAGGRPYFVMEYVNGPPLTGCCGEKKLTLRERLHLFEFPSLQERSRRSVPIGARLDLRAASGNGRYLPVPIIRREGNSLELWGLDTPDRVVFTRPTSKESLPQLIFGGDDKTFALASSDGAVALRNTETGKIYEFFAHYRPVRHVAFSPDGSRLATMDDSGRVKLWEAATGRELLPLPRPRNLNYFDRLTFSLDGHRLMLTAAGNLVIWDATPWTDPGGSAVTEYDRNRNRPVGSRRQAIPTGLGQRPGARSARPERSLHSIADRPRVEMDHATQYEVFPAAPGATRVRTAGGPQRPQRRRCRLGRPQRLADVRARPAGDALQ